MPAHRPLTARFWEKVRKAGPNDCWEWMAATSKFGYGRIGTGPHEVMLAHRVSFWLANGILPPFVLHTCDNPPCCNPRHLYSGTQSDNLRDAYERGRKIAVVPDNRGERHGMSKLTDDDVRAIRSIAGSNRIIAPLFGVSSSAIQSVRSRKYWSHVT